MAEPAVGGITDIDVFVNNPVIESLAKFAIDEYNKKQHAHLELVKLVGAWNQVVTGFIHYIILETTDGGNKQVYVTKILEPAVNNVKEVLEFKLIIPTETLRSG